MAAAQRSHFVRVAPGSLLTECTRPPGCQRIRIPLLWERNVCYASPPLCPHAAPATMLFVAMSALENLLGKGNFKLTSLYSGTGDPTRLNCNIQELLNPPLLISFIPVVNFAPPSRHPQNIPYLSTGKPSFSCSCWPGNSHL